MNKKTSILVVDDEPGLLQIYSDILRHEGYEVWEASTGQEGLQAARERRPDVVLLDVILPDLSGMEVCRQIKADPALLDVFVVLNSGGATSVAHKVDGLETGADDYLVKPLDTVEFLARLRTIVRLRNTTAALRASEQRHRRLVEILPDAVWLIDLQGQVLAVNPRGVEMLGYAIPGELLKRTVFDLTRPRDRERLRADLATTLETGTLRNAEHLLLRKTGEAFPVEISAAVAAGAEGQPSGIVLVARDTTERKRAEEQIQLLADAVQSSRDMICITDQENRFTFANRAFLQSYGYTAEEVMGRTPAFLYSAKNPPGLTGLVFQQTLCGGWEGEILNCRKDGTEFPILLDTAPIKSNEGRTLGLVGVARDISERIRSEKQNAAFAHLGYRLSAAGTREQAAQIIMDIASELFGWDAGYVHLYSESDDQLIPVLTVDTLDGRRTPVQPTSFTPDPSPLMRLVMKEGAQLINRDNERQHSLPLVPFGGPRHSASMMFVPIRAKGDAIGILSIQSYTPRAYSEEDLKVLQTLADHCGDTLQRIELADLLRQAEVKYRSIFEHATEGIFQTSPEGRFRSANPALAHILGYPTPEDLMASVTDVGRQTYADPEKRQEFKRVVETQGIVQGFEIELHRKDRSKIWMSINAHLVRDQTGAVLYYEGTLHDITERRWVENLLRRQRDFGIFLSLTTDSRAAAERLLRTALENEGLDCGAVYVMNSQTKILEFAAHQGLSADFVKRSSPHAPAAVRDHLADAQPTTLRPEVWPMATIVQQLKLEGLLALEVIPIQHSGQVVAVLNVGSRAHTAIPSKTRQAIEALAAQAGGAITRIRAEQSLRTSRQVLEKTIHGLLSAVFIIDAHRTTIEDCNPAATRMFGHSREEMIGQSPSLLHLSEATCEEFRRHLHATVKEKGFLSEFELRMKRKDGTTFAAEQNVVPIRSDGGEIVSWVGVIQDITTRKTTEEGLRELPRRIIEAQENERQRVARELHDSVNQVIASVKMRLRKIGEIALLNPAARELLARCEELLVLALEENRRIAHDLRPADLDALGLNDVCRNFCRQFQARTNLVVKTRLARFAQRCPPAMELNLFRIVQEALNNVEKHACAKTILLQFVVQKTGLILKIRDDGRGFNPAASKAAKRRGEGIGLTNMRERAAIMGGTCELESVPNQGTTITVRVPLQAH